MWKGMMENRKYCPSWYHRMYRVCKHQILAVNIVFFFCCLDYRNGWTCLNKAQEFGPLDAALFFWFLWLSQQRLSNRCWIFLHADRNLTSPPPRVYTLFSSVTQTLPSHRSICITVTALSLYNFSWQARSYIHRLRTRIQCMSGYLICWPTDALVLATICWCNWFKRRTSQLHSARRWRSLLSWCTRQRVWHVFHCSYGLWFNLSCFFASSYSPLQI